MTTPASLPGLPNLTQALQTAQGEGLISQSASNRVIQNFTPFIAQGMTGPDPRQVRSPSVVVVHLFIDDSYSMKGYCQTVIDQGNAFLAKLRRSTERDSMVIRIDAIRSKPESITGGFRRISNPSLPPTDPRNQNCVEDFGPHNITCSHSTALNDTLYEGLAGTIAYVSNFAQNSQLKRLIVAVISDGQNCGQKNHSEGDVKALMEDLHKTERAFSLFFGFGPVSDFNGPALAMGFPQENIIVESAITAKTLGDKLMFVSDAIISASQGMTIAAPPPSTTVPPFPGSNSGFVSP